MRSRIHLCGRRAGKEEAQAHAWAHCCRYHGNELEVLLVNRILRGMKEIPRRVQTSHAILDSNHKFQVKPEKVGKL